MQRIVVVGCSGSGKSILSRALATRLGLPVIHLDALYWRPGWTPSLTDEGRHGAGLPRKGRPGVRPVHLALTAGEPAGAGVARHAPRTPLVVPRTDREVAAFLADPIARISGT